MKEIFINSLYLLGTAISLAIIYDVIRRTIKGDEE